MRIVQILGWVLLLLTLMFGLYEAVQYFRAGSRSLTGIAQFWHQQAPFVFGRFHGFMSDVIGPAWLWLVNLPVLFVSGTLAVVCLFATYATGGGAAAR